MKDKKRDSRLEWCWVAINTLWWRLSMPISVGIGSLFGQVT